MVLSLASSCVPKSGLASASNLLALDSALHANRLILLPPTLALATLVLVLDCSPQVDNTDPTARPGEFTDLSAVDKFELTDAEYAARRDTVQAHLKANKLGKYADVPEPIAWSPPPRSQVPADAVVGARCELAAEGGSVARRGTIRFIGIAEIGKGGIWIGVELDEPLGKGDGRWVEQSEGQESSRKRRRRAILPVLAEARGVRARRQVDRGRLPGGGPDGRRRRDLAGDKI